MSVRIRDRLLRDHGRLSDAVEFEEKLAADPRARRLMLMAAIGDPRCDLEADDETYARACRRFEREQCRRIRRLRAGRCA